MNRLVTSRHYTIEGDGVLPSVRRAVDSYARRNYGTRPGVIYLHPDRIPADWPGDLPPVQANAFMSRNHVGVG